MKTAQEIYNEVRDYSREERIKRFYSLLEVAIEKAIEQGKTRAHVEFKPHQFPSCDHPDFYAKMARAGYGVQVYLGDYPESLYHVILEWPRPKEDKILVDNPDPGP